MKNMRKCICKDNWQNVKVRGILMSIAKTIAEKIFSIKADKPLIAGDIVVTNIDYGMTHDVNAASVIEMFNMINLPEVREPEKFSVFLDHLSPSPTTDIANMHKNIIEFAKKHNIKYFMPGRGVCHQIALENVSILPGQIAIGTDSHTCTYGCLNSLAMSVGASEMAVAFASSECWFRVPETIRVELTGKLIPPASAKDVTLELLGRLGESGAAYKCIEFGGTGLSSLSLDSKAVLANMSTEMGAKTAVMEPDEILVGYLASKGIFQPQLVYPDPEAKYCKIINVDLGKVRPMVAIPPHIDNVMPVCELEEIHVNQVVIGSCTNGRMEDFENAANILRGQRAAPGVKLIIVPASSEIYLGLITRGYLEIFINAGALVNPPGCGPCAGALGGLAADGDVVVATTNRCLKGRMGSKFAKIYIASPETAAYSAVSGKLSCEKNVGECI